MDTRRITHRVMPYVEQSLDTFLNELKERVDRLEAENKELKAKLKFLAADRDKPVWVTFQQIVDGPGMSDEFCEAAGLNPWCLNEGRASLEDKTDIPWHVARDYGLL